MALLIATDALGSFLAGYGVSAYIRHRRLARKLRKIRANSRYGVDQSSPKRDVPWRYTNES